MTVIMFFMDAHTLTTSSLVSNGEDTSPVRTKPTPVTIDYNHGSKTKDRDREKRRERRRDERTRDRKRYGNDSDSDHEYRRERRDRSPRRERRRRNTSSPDSVSEGSPPDYRSSYDNGRRSDSYESYSPNNTIMVRNMTSDITENEIRMDIITCGMMPKDIRLIRRKDSGASRGFAFVEFNTVQEASRWMELRQGKLDFPDGCKAYMQYSIPKEGERSPAITKDIRMAQDWVCFKCATRNFKRRDTCFKCNISRSESEMSGHLTEDVSSHPTNTILLRNLNVLTTEEGVLEVLQGVSSLPIRAVRIARDPINNISKGVCYIELNSVVDAIHLFKYLSLHNTIDGRQVVVSYAKLSQAGVSVADAVLAAAQWKSVANTTSTTNTSNISQLAEYSASQYAKNPEEHAAYKQYYEDYYRRQQAAGNQLSLPIQSSTSSNISPSSTSTASTSSKYPVPDVSKYQYDETSGYYYDPITGFYYDANSQYYYDSKSASFMYWDSTKHTYLPAPEGAVQPTAQPPPPPQQQKQPKEEEEKKKKKDDGDKVKVAKKIAKDMEKWAKELNQKKDAAKQQQNMLKAQRKSELASRGAADAGYAILEKKSANATTQEKPENEEELVTETQTNKQQQENLSSLVASYGGGSDSEDEPPEDIAAVEERFTDWSKMACLLCKRQFPTKDALVRHQQLSDLHKQNMIKAMPSKSSQSGHYRDRAAERRKKFGTPGNPQPNKLKEKYLAAREEAEATRYEQPNKHGIDSTNLGSRMMEKMGWSHGQGLGKKGQGRTDIIQPEVRAQAVGLGSKATSYTPGPGETYRDAIRKMTLNRYKELQQ